MSFDQSRSASNPWSSWRDFLGVVMQQGRVQLDSDWNELVAEFARRIQAGTLDLIGLSGVPSTTPYGFKINAFFATAGNPPVQVPHITIGAGRIYIDGLLAENHGMKNVAQWDPALDEWSSAPQLPGMTESDIDYTQQPYLPGAVLPSKPGPFLVYLDVWQREVGYIQAPDLMEPALGIDTTGRLQTVWQVKLVDISGVAGGVTCSSADAAVAPWENIILPSTSQLTRGFATTGTSGNCALTPAASYTGLENQLYRVEIHQGGIASPGIPTFPLPAGTATFKWSRENASVATGVTAIASVTNSAGNPASELTVQSLGRDQVLGFKGGDWVEITDDYLELNFQQLSANGQPGQLHWIDSIDSAARTIVLDSAATGFPVDSNGQTDPTRHTRIRRWDQSGVVYLDDGSTPWMNLNAAVSAGVSGGSNGIPVPPSGTNLILEDGITVTFGPAGNSFAAGEFWAFAARAADGSADALTNCPPMGIRHHYCRLGIVNFSASPPTVTDCRRVFPSLANPCIHVTQVFAGSTPLINNGTISIQTLVQSGLTVNFDAPLDPSIINTGAPNYPICMITVDLPAGAPNAGTFARVSLPGFISTAGTITATTTPPVIPAAAAPPASASANSLTWIPSPALAALESQFSLTTPFLARLSLKGNLIWSQGNARVYLNGAGDGRPSADFDLWFWLNSQPPAILSTTNLAFTTPQLVGTASTQVVTVTNTSSAAALTITSIAIAGPNTADFTETNTGLSVPANQSCTITVTFKPSAVGTRTAQLNVVIPQGAGSLTLSVALSGIGIQPGVTATAVNLVFPSTVVGNTSAVQPVTLTSSGSSQLTISSIAVSANFRQVTVGLSSPTSGTLQPGQQCTIQVQFSPLVTGAITGSLVIAHNAPNSPLVIPLSGTAIPGTPGVSPSTTSLNFGSVFVGSAPVGAVTLTSSGTAPLVITGVLVSGNGFTLTSNTCNTLQPTAQCALQVTFRPPAAGGFTGNLTINHNASGSPLVITLSGTGVVRKVIEKIQIDKVTDKVKVSDVAKVADRVAAPFVSPATPHVVEPTAETEAPAGRAFIRPEERPPVGTESLGEAETPNDAPTGEGQADGSSPGQGPQEG